MDKIELKLKVTKRQSDLLHDCISYCRNNADNPMMRDLYGVETTSAAWTEINVLFGEIIRAQHAN